MNTIVLFPEPSQTTGRPGSITASGARPRRILLLDDEPVLRRMVAAFLAQAGYYIDTAADGEQGWSALNLRRYDLLLTDNDMPHLSGVALVRRLRAAGIAVPIIVVSGSETVQRLPDRDALDLSAVLAKPFHPLELMGSVARVAPLPPGTPPGQVQAAPQTAPLACVA